MPQSPIQVAAFGQLKSKALAMLGLGQQQEAFVGQRHGRNYEAAYAGAIGMVENPSGVTTTVGLATTYVGLCLSNPAGSGKNLVLLNASASLIVAPATITTLDLAVGYSAAGIVTHTTPLTPLPSVVGSGNALVGLADSACTLVGSGANAPTAVRKLGQCGTATTSFSVSAEIDGSIILPPGAWAAFVTNIAGPASGFQGSFLWEEVAP